MLEGLCDWISSFSFFDLKGLLKVQYKGMRIYVLLFTYCPSMAGWRTQTKKAEFLRAGRSSSHPFFLICPFSFALFMVLITYWLSSIGQKGIWILISSFLFPSKKWLLEGKKEECNVSCAGV